MPLSYINSLYSIALNQQADENSKKQKEAEDIEDEAEEAIGI